MDRAQAIRSQTVVNGIDFVFVHPSQVLLDVHFLIPPSTQLQQGVTAAAVHITPVEGDDGLPGVPVAGISWPAVGAETVLRIETAHPGDFRDYILHLDAAVDRYFNDVRFSFKAACASPLDCAPAEGPCPAGDEVDADVDYLARDFWSFRRALMDFAAQRYPHWNDAPLAPDVAVMLAEVMSALGDELAYYQDRIGREAYLESATQRRSLRRHARLVDYPVHDGLAGATWLDVTVVAGGSGPVAAGTGVEARDAGGGVRARYEVGRGLAEVIDGVVQYEVTVGRNRFTPHLWDEGDACLPAGATELYLAGAHAGDLPLDGVEPGLPLGRWVLLQAVPVDPALPVHRAMVRLVEVEDLSDDVLGQPVTRIAWDRSQATRSQLDLGVLEVRGNLLPITPGRTEVRRFTIGPSTDPVQQPSAVERDGPNRSVTYLFSLPGTEDEGLVRLGPDAERARPEIDLREVASPGDPWRWRPSLLGVSSSQADDPDFTLDDGTWRRVVSYQRAGAEIVHRDYASADGATVRFGDGRFGRVPPVGTVFEATYRVGNGRAADVAAGSLTALAGATLAFVESVTNPLAAAGVDPQPAEEVRQLAPDAFRAVAYRAVRPEDYAEAAQRLEWVQRAGAQLRWTGSWLSAFVTPDPRRAATLPAGRRAELQAHVDRFRQAGRESHVLDPVYADLDVEVTVCVDPHFYAGDVHERVMAALVGAGPQAGPPGFFDPDRVTFGDPLDRSALESAVQRVPGVRAVEGIRLRRRGRFGWRELTELAYRVAHDEVVRVANDPLHPERGSLRLVTRGGA